MDSELETMRDKSLEAALVVEKDIKPLEKLFIKCKEDWIHHLAQALAFSLLTILVPITVLLLVTFGAISWWLDAPTQHMLTMRLENIMPAPFSAPATEMFSKAFNAYSHASILAEFIIVALAILFGSFFFSLLELCFDVIYHLQPRPMLRRHIVAIGMLFLFIALTSILIVASVAPTIFLTLLFPVQVSSIHNSVFLDISSYIGSIVISLVLFQAIYVMVPHRHITFRTLGHHIGKSWRGALVSTAVMQLFLVLFPIYATLFMNNYIGEVGFVLILLLFFYIFMLILLLGAEINAFFAEGIRVPQSDLITEASKGGYRNSTELTLKFPGTSNNP